MHFSIYSRLYTWFSKCIEWPVYMTSSCDLFGHWLQLLSNIAKYNHLNGHQILGRLEGSGNRYIYINIIREHPFNLKWGGYGFFWGKHFCLLEKKFLSQKWAEKNIMLALCALKIIVFVEKKIMLREKKFCEKKYFDSEKNHSPPPLK